jgi:2-methylcitrate dehydratase PrpD
LARMWRGKEVAMSEYLTRLSEFAEGLRFQELPSHVVTRAKEVLADTLAVIAAGAQEPEVLEMSRRLVPRPGNGPATLLGQGYRVDVLNASLVNGTAGTFLELDEGNQFARGHPAIHVVPAVLAVAEAEGFGGEAVIVALVLGYEIGARVGIASRIRMSMHPHGTWGTVGAAVAVAKLYGCDASAMREIINVSSSLGLATSRRTMLEGGTVRNVYSGVSNQMGVVAHRLVASGFTGEADGLSTVYGGVVSETFSPEAMTEQLGERYEISRNYFKRHACCRYNHSALDNLQVIVSRLPGGRILPDQVERVEVETYSLAAQLCDQSPKNMLAAKFSIPFAVATYLVNGETGVRAFRPQQVANQTVQALAKRVIVKEDPALTAMMPARRPSRVRLFMKDGTIHEAETHLNKGDFEDPYSPDELRRKYFELAWPVWGEAVAEALYEDVSRLEDVQDIRRVTDRLIHG